MYDKHLESAERFNKLNVEWTEMYRKQFEELNNVITTIKYRLEKEKIQIGSPEWKEMVSDVEENLKKRISKDKYDLPYFELKNSVDESFKKANQMFKEFDTTL